MQLSRVAIWENTLMISDHLPAINSITSRIEHASNGWRRKAIFKGEALPTENGDFSSIYLRDTNAFDCSVEGSDLVPGLVWVPRVKLLDLARFYECTLLFAWVRLPAEDVDVIAKATTGVAVPAII